MFTLNFKNGSNSTVVCASRYDIRLLFVKDGSRAGAAIITVFQQLPADHGIEYHIGQDLSFVMCFVENSTGKMIDRIGPFEPGELGV